MACVVWQAGEQACKMKAEVCMMILCELASHDWSGMCTRLWITATRCCLTDIWPR
jgi:hypothetical protein